MMKVLVVLSALFAISSAGVVHHDSEGHKATSYQNIHIEHFHSVPTYVKKEDAHLLEHPISKGETSAKVEVHHGNKHEHGFAIADAHTALHGHEEHQDVGHHFVAVGGGHHQEEHHDFHIPQHEGGEDHGHVAYEASAEDHGLGGAEGHYELSHHHEESHGLGHYH